jgi:phosphinothricin acetyltransferase
VIRAARADDAEAIAEIYAPYVRETVVSFELEPPGGDEMRARMAAAHLWLVSEEEGRVVAYAYASPHRARAAYRWAVEVSVYVGRGWQRRGHGRALYLCLLELLRARGYVHALAGIALPNPGSVGLHESLGFEPVGVYRQIGYKFATWHDVGWWQLRLNEAGADPELPVERRAT